MFDGTGREPSGFFLVHEALALVAYGDPAALDELPADEADLEARLERADCALCDAIAEGAVLLDGRRGDANGKGRFFRVVHERVEADFFKNKRRSFLPLSGWAALRWRQDDPWHEWLHHRASMDEPDWGDLRFPAALLLARFPRRSAGTEPGSAALAPHSALPPPSHPATNRAPQPVYSPQALRA